MSKFKVGDRVNNSTYGIGVVTEVDFEIMPHIPYRVTFDKRWHWMQEDSLALSEPIREFIVIRRDGQRTIAELRHGREVVKSAEAKCMPTDTFDFFNEGAPRAFDRLMGQHNIEEAIKAWNKPSPAPEPKYYSGKVFAVRMHEGSFSDTMRKRRIGHVFEVKGGSFVKDYCEFGLPGTITLPKFKSFHEFSEYFSATEWAEVKE